MPLDLAIVIPVYNEEKSIQALLEDFYKILTEECISYTFFIINDGSTDGSWRKLEVLSTYIPNLQLLSEPNCGHGPSLLKGYQLAINHQWVFQFDSDYQYTLSAFRELWRKKEAYDLLLAEREARHASYVRHSITMVLKQLVRLLYGNGVQDINVPYRLIRASQLKKALSKIRSNSFAPNTLITAYFLKNKLRTFSTVSVLKQDGCVKQSRMTMTIFKGCVRSILDLMTFRFKI